MKWVTTSWTDGKKLYSQILIFLINIIIGGFKQLSICLTESGYMIIWWIWSNTKIEKSGCYVKLLILMLFVPFFCCCPLLFKRPCEHG